MKRPTTLCFGPRIGRFHNNLDRSIHTLTHKAAADTLLPAARISRAEAGGSRSRSRAAGLSSRFFAREPSSFFSRRESLLPFFGLSKNYCCVRRHPSSRAFIGQFPIGTEQTGMIGLKGLLPLASRLLGGGTRTRPTPLLFGLVPHYSGAANPGLVVPRGAPRTHHLDPAGLYAGSWLAGAFVSDACCFLSPAARPAAWRGRQLALRVKPPPRF